MEPLTFLAEDGVRIFVRYSDIRRIFLVAQYSAATEFQPLAAIFNDAMQGETTSLRLRILMLYNIEPLDKVCSDKPSVEDVPLAFDAQSAVVCLDGDDVTDKSNTFWWIFLQKHISVSRLAGSFWTNMRLGCAGWRYRPNWPFRGPFKTPHPSKSVRAPEHGRPSAPLLFMSNRLDPVTPLRSARNMAKSHPSSGVLVQESVGHCVILGAMGPCVKKALAEYFDKGVVASEEVSCEPTSGPWD